MIDVTSSTAALLMHAAAQRDLPVAYVTGLAIRRAAERILNGYDIDFAADVTRVVNRLRDALLAVSPSLECAVGDKLTTSGGVRDALSRWDTPNVPAFRLFPRREHPPRPSPPSSPAHQS